MHKRLSILFSVVFAMLAFFPLTGKCGEEITAPWQISLTAPTTDRYVIESVTFHNANDAAARRAVIKYRIVDGSGAERASHKIVLVSDAFNDFVAQFGAALKNATKSAIEADITARYDTIQ